MDGLRAPRVEVLLLGPVEIRVDGQPVRVGARRQRALLARLALAGGEVVSVDRLMSTLWDDDPPANAKGNIQSYVSRLRALLGEGAIVFEPGGYRLAVPADATDVGRVEAAVTSARDLCAAGWPAAEARYLLALGHWRGPTLGDLTDHLDLEPDAARYDELRDTLVDELADGRLRAGMVATALAGVREQAARRPMRERTHLLLMRALHADGQSAEALRVGDAYRRRLADETGLDPGPELRDLEARILAGDFEDPPAVLQPAAPSPAAPPPGALPRLGRFVGRSVEVEALDRLAATAALVTVTGPGGIGKTRLVAEWLARHGGDRPTVVVELASAGTDEVVATVAAAVGARTAGDLDALVELLSVREVRLVLDNCEHVLDAARGLARAVGVSCPSVSVVATSRNRLGLPSEHVLPLAPLPHGRPDAEAIELLCDRIATADPHFDPDRADIDAVREVCRRLDGLPLALELAAGRVATLGLGGLHRRLDDALDLLVTPGRPHDRHASLREVVQWSLRQLDDDTRRLAVALTIFEDAFDLDAAECVGACVTASPVALLVSHLVDASLLVPEDRGGTRRFRMLRTVRDAGRAAMASDGLEAAVRTAHAGWVAATTRRETDRALGPDERPALARLELLRPDLRAALRLAVETADPDLAGRLAGPLGRLLVYRPDAEASDWLRRLADLPDLGAPPVAATILGAAARAAYLQGDLDACDRWARETVDRAGPGSGGLARHSLGVRSLYAGDHGEAERWWLQILDDPGSEPAARIDALGGVALARSYAGDHEGAREAAGAVVDLADRLDHDTSRAWAAYVSGEVALGAGRPEPAEDHLRTAIALAEDVGAWFIVGVAGTALVSSLVGTGRRAEARRRGAALLEHWMRWATWPQIWTTLRLLAGVLADDDPSLAAEILDAADDDPAAPRVTGADRDRLDALRGSLPAAAAERQAPRRRMVLVDAAVEVLARRT